MGSFLASKKVKVALIGLVVTVLSPIALKFGITEETLRQIVETVGVVAGGYVLGQGVADGLSGGKTSSANGK